VSTGGRRRNRNCKLRDEERLRLMGFGGRLEVGGGRRTRGIGGRGGAGGMASASFSGTWEEGKGRGDEEEEGAPRWCCGLDHCPFLSFPLGEGGERPFD